MIVMTSSATAAGAPWWGQPVISGLALLAGALLTLVGSNWRWRRQDLREDRKRWDDLILETAVKVEALCARLAEMGRTGWPGYVADYEERIEAHIAISEQLNEAMSKFKLVASRRLSDSCRDLYGAALREELGVDEPNEAGSAYERFETARTLFVSEVRREIRSNSS